MSSLILEDLKWSFDKNIDNNNIDNNDNENNETISMNDIDFIFPIDENINKKMYLFCGECYKLPADALVIGNYESLSYRGEENNPIFALAGPSFEREVEEIENCLSGSSVIVKGGTTVFNHIIFSIGPKYDINYDQTCDITLWSAYYSALNLAISNNNSPPIKTLAICCLYLKSKKYPRDLGAHVALRTIRKYLSHNAGQKLEKIIICCNNPEDYAIYNSLMPAYFPRSLDECLLQSNILPDNLGNEWGEQIIENRKVTITAGPRPSLEGNIIRPRLSLEGNVKTGTSSLAVTWKIPRGMTEVITNDDNERIMRIENHEKNLTNEEKLDKKFDKLILKSTSEDLSDIESTNFCTIIGRDRLGQSIILLTAAHINPETISMDRLLMYIMNICEPFKGLPYVLIYAYSGVQEGVSVPSGDHLNQLFELFSHRYSLHLSNFFILHPTMSLRVFLSMPYLSNRFWKNSICIDSIMGLTNYIDITIIGWPLIVRNYELNF